MDPLSGINGYIHLLLSVKSVVTATSLGDEIKVMLKMKTYEVSVIYCKLNYITYIFNFLIYKIKKKTRGSEKRLKNCGDGASPLVVGPHNAIILFK